ncbi:MAG: hypothetical protein WC389_17350 [Lutibacter sp.]|jgi:hypothetical protein
MKVQWIEDLGKEAGDYDSKRKQEWKQYDDDIMEAAEKYDEDFEDDE